MKYSPWYRTIFKVINMKNIKTIFCQIMDFCCIAQCVTYTSVPFQLRQGWCDINPAVVVRLTTLFKPVYSAWSLCGWPHRLGPLRHPVTASHGNLSPYMTHRPDLRISISSRAPWPLTRFYHIHFDVDGTIPFHSLVKCGGVLWVDQLLHILSVLTY